jgi:hypothetical protein
MIKMSNEGERNQFNFFGGVGLLGFELRASCLLGRHSTI